MADNDDNMDNESQSPSLADAINGPAAAAILMMLLEENDAAAILKHLDPSEIRSLGKAMYAASVATEGQIDKALFRFVEGSQSVSALASGAGPKIRTVMHQALGNVRADNLLAEIAPKSSAVALDILRWMEAPTIIHILKEEHPQVGAIIVSVLTPEVAAEVLGLLDENLQTDLVLRSAKLTSVSGDAIADIETILSQSSEIKCSLPGMILGGKSDTAKIVNSMKKADMEKILRSVKKRDKVLGQAIEDEMFIFDNLNDLDSKSLGTVMRSVDAAQLALALKGAAPELIDRMLGSMSARAAETIRDGMAEGGLVKRSEVEEAQRGIIAIARKLAETGEIMLGDQGDDYV